MKKTLFVLPLLVSSLAWADIEKEFEGLGGNRVILEKAQELNPEKEVSVVQERTVSRRNRWELSPEYSGSFGGDTYVKTMSLGLNVQYHITPRWSLGVKYNRSYNKLTDEGNQMVDNAIAEYERSPSHPTVLIPDIDYPREEKMAMINWYPIYGKMNLLDKGIAQFDVYALAGYGQVEMKSGAKPSYTAGGGLGIWWTQHFATRLEMRYQNYKAQYIDGDRELNVALASVQMGWLL